MRVTFVFEGLFPGESRAARHVEALAGRFQLKGHAVSVVTTEKPDARDPEGIDVLRLSHPPGAVSDKDSGLFLKNISRHLKQAEVQLLFAEGLAPMSALAVKAAGELGIPAIVRVLSDRGSIVHGFSEGRRTSPRVVKKKISALLEHASVVAASSESCASLLKPHYDGPIHVIERCVDLNVFRAGRTTKRDMDAFLAEWDARGRRILLYARENLRESTPAQVFPMLPRLREYAADILFLVVGDLDRESFVADAERGQVTDLVRAPGPLEGRPFFAAYEAASVFLVPPESRASGREILEAMAMGCVIACHEGNAAVEEGIVVPGECGVLLPAGDFDEAARRLGELLQDDERLESLQEKAVAAARRHDINVAIDQVEKLAVDVLGMARRSVEADVPAARGDEEKSEMSDESKSRAAEGGGKGADEGRGGGGPKEEGRRREPRRRRGRGGEASSGSSSEREGQPSQGSKGSSGSSGRGRDRGRGRGRRRRPRSSEDVEELGASTGIDVLDVSPDREGRRTWDLEPGLTLKELMPFLRPPKTVLILGASTGIGHARAATALAEAMKGEDNNLMVRQMDVIELVAKLYRPPYVRTLLEDLSRNPALFGTPFETGGSGDAALPEDFAEFLAKAFDSKLDEFVVDKRPDHLVCTHWLPFKHFEKLKEEEKLAAGVVAVVCDPVIHDHWISPVVSHYLVPDEQQKTHLTLRGIDAGMVSVTGIPVSPSFTEDVSRDRIANELGLKQQLPTVLLRPGGIGATERILDVVRRLLELGSPLNLLIVAGKNDRLREELEKLEAPGESVVKPFGFVQNIRDLMGAADLLVTRASPHTLAESLAAGLPLVLLRPTAGIEERHADQLLQWNVAVKAYGETDLEVTLKELLGNRRRLREMQEAARSCRRADAAVVAVERLTRIVK